MSSSSLEAFHIAPEACSIGRFLPRMVDNPTMRVLGSEYPVQKHTMSCEDIHIELKFS
jgi:hypothetical protein